MITTRSSIVINRPLPTVWEFITDLNNYSIWQPGIGRITATDGLNVGSVLKADFHYLGRDYSTAAEIIESDGSSYYKARSVQGPITYVLTYQLTPEGEGTRFTIDSQGEMGTLLKMAEPVIKYMSETRREANLRVLKSVLESEVTEVA